MNYFNIYTVFTRAVFSYFFKLKKNKNLYISGYSLLRKPTFRLSEENKKDSLIAIRVLKNTMQLVWSKKSSHLLVNSSKIAVFDSGFKSKEIRKQQVLFYGEEETGLYIARNGLLSYGSKLIKIINSVQAFLLFLLIFPFSVFSAYRVNYALLISELIEANSLVAICKKYNVQKLHFFCPYEKDANMLAVIIMSKGIEVNKIPSPGPLISHNSILVANNISLSNPYQQEELMAFKETIAVDRNQYWGPEQGINYISKYISKSSRNSPFNTIGIYSHASWLRVNQKHANIGLGDIESEVQLLHDICPVLKSMMDIKVFIFLHPKEKKSEIVMKKTRKHYDSVLKGVDYLFFDMNLSSSEAFGQVDLGIGALSTILFERLFCGYKTLFYPIKVNGFPLPNSNLKRICAHSSTELKEKISTSLNISEEEFFQKNQLEEYRFNGNKEAYLRKIPST